MFRLYFLTLLLSLCIINVYAQQFKWSSKVGSITADFGSCVVVDSEQDIFDAVSFTGTASVPNGTFITSLGAEDILIRRTSSNGILQWIKQLGGKKDDFATDISVDNSDNIFVTGTFKDSLFFDNQFLLRGNANNINSFIIKMSPQGTILWSKQFNSDISVSIRCVTAGLTEELLVTGVFEGFARFDSNQAFSSNGGTDIFILKLNGNSGNITMARQIGGFDSEFVLEHVRDNLNNIYLIGDFRQLVDLDPGLGEFIVNTKGLTDIFVLKLTTFGTFSWAKTFGGTGLDYGHSIALDSKRDIVMTGRFSDVMNMSSDLPQLTSNGGTDIFVSKLNTNGNVVWANGFGDNQNDVGNKVIINRNDVIYIGGSYRGRVDFDPSTAFFNGGQSNGGSDIFVAIYNQDGSYNDYFVLGGIANDGLNDFALKLNGELISIGAFGAIMDFDPSSSEVSIFANGSSDAFMVNIFQCIHPYLKSLKANDVQACFGDNTLLQIEEGYLNDATQWSWQRDSCNGITFASGSFLDLRLTKNTSFFVKGFGNCVNNEPCQKIDVSIFTDSLIYQDIKLCQGDTLKVGAGKHTAAGVYTDTLTSVSGCDSVVVSEVTMLPTFLVSQSRSICNGDTVKVGNNNFTVAGTFTTIFQTVNGCDSVVVTKVSILPSKLETAEAIICKGDSVTVGNQTYYGAGKFIQSSIGPNGCEDLLIVTIIELETQFFNSYQLCRGERIKVGNNFYFTSGNFIDSLTSSFGCDSVLYSTVTILNNSTFTQDVSLCEGESILIGNIIRDKTGNFVDTLVNNVGCDSIVKTNIRVYPRPEAFTQNVTLCEGQNIRVGQKLYSLSGNYIDTLSNANGCDSVVTTNLVVIEKDYALNVSRCEGDSYLFGGDVIDKTGIYVKNYKNINQCDSVVTLDFKSIKQLILEKSFFICPGERVLIGNSVYESPGTYKDTLVSTFGCDSIIISTIGNRNVSEERFFEICQGDSIEIDGSFYKTTGTYKFTYTKQDGCDSLLSVVLNVKANSVFNTSFDICKGGSVTVGSSTYFNAGTYTETLTSKNGCDSVVNFEVKVVNFVPFFFRDKDTLKTNEIPDATYQWFECINGDRIPFLGANDSKFNLFKSGKYALGITYQSCTYFSDCLDIFLSNTENDFAHSSIMVFPNPVIDWITIDIQKSGYLDIMDTNGKQWHSTPLHVGKQTMDVSFLPSGMYLVRLRYANQFAYSKFVKL